MAFASSVVEKSFSHLSYGSNIFNIIKFANIAAEFPDVMDSGRFRDLIIVG